MSDSVYKVGLIGFGNIGTGVVRHVLEKGDLISERIGRKLELGAIADRDFSAPRAVTPPPGTKLTTDWKEIVADPTIHAVIELVGVGADGKPTLANDIARATLAAGKDFITANKALIATHGVALQEIADANNSLLLFEASVGAGIPLIASMQQGLGAARVTGIHGILNGTCNYIFARMGEDPTLTMDAAIKEAQELGYAEPDPSADVEGTDTAYKISILASLGFGHQIPVGSFPIEGILGIGPEDMQYAAEHNMTVKLLGFAREYPNGVTQVGVGPFFLPSSHILASVRGVMNGMLITADPIGDTLYYGAGAGQPSTASGLMADVMRSAAHRSGATPLLPLKLTRRQESAAAGVSSQREAHYLRIRLSGASAAAMEPLVPGTVVRRSADSVTIVTNPLSEQELQESLAKIGSLGVSSKQITRIRYAFVSQ